MRMKLVKVSIIIANHNWDELFRKTVKSVLRALTVTNQQVEVIVVSNGMGVGGVDGIEKAEKVRQYLQGKPVRLLQLQEGNPCKARNLGAKIAEGKYLVFLDNDTWVEEGWLDRVVKYLDKHPRVGGGQLKLLRTKNLLVTNQQVERRVIRRWVYDSAGEMITKDGFLVERAREAEDEGQFDQADLIFSGKGAGLVVRRSVFEKVGGFDEDYIYYWEEPDLFWRIWKAQYEVRFLWMGVLYHAYGTKLKPVPRVPMEAQVYLACRNQVMTILKNGEGSYRRRMLVRVGFSWLGLGSLFLLRGRLKQAWAVKRAWQWLVWHWGEIKEKRRWISGEFKSDDGWIERLLVERDFKWYLGKAKAYISGKPF